MSDLGEMDRAELAALVIGHPAIDRALHHIAALEAEVERLRARIPDPDDLLLLLDGLPENPDPGLAALWWASYDRLRATLEGVKDD